MRIILAFMLVLCSIQAHAKEWVFVVQPERIEILDAKYLRPKTFFLQHYNICNMINLSFFTHKEAIPPHKGMNTFNYDMPRKGWGIFWIDKLNKCNIDTGGAWSVDIAFRSKAVAAGYPMLVYNKKIIPIKKSTFANRKCPRTALGILETGEVLIYVSQRATLYDVQKFMYKRECISVLNFDGGGSTFLFVNGKKIFSSQPPRKYPNILSW
ncbi:hypothetical protein [Microcystis phage Mel-JY01]